jgi:hypothetical protein
MSDRPTSMSHASLAVIAMAVAAFMGVHAVSYFVVDRSGADLPVCQSLARMVYDEEHQSMPDPALPAQLDMMGRLHCGNPVAPTPAEVAQAAASTGQLAAKALQQQAAEEAALRVIAQKADEELARRAARDAAK